MVVNKYIAYVNDSKCASYGQANKYFNEILLWAKEHCQSFIHFEVVDVSDVSITCDQIAEFHFEHEKDLLMFNLKWSAD